MGRLEAIALPCLLKLLSGSRHQKQTSQNQEHKYSVFSEILALEKEIFRYTNPPLVLSQDGFLATQFYPVACLVAPSK